VEAIEGDKRAEKTGKRSTSLHQPWKESVELGAEGVPLLGVELVLLLPHGLPPAIILDEPRPQLGHLHRSKALGN
jgi:hypothetical protein